MAAASPDTLGGRLAWARSLRGLTQHQLAVLIDVREKNVSRWESDQNEPTAKTVALLADALHVSTDFLLGRPSGEHDVQAYYERVVGEKLRRRARRNGSQTGREPGPPKRRRSSGGA